ncbi:uncharacterized protein sc:d156 [Carassius auratus]|uniref:Uncharacterized protein sc:d156 n=1 Tax=Carassius auratus TaxID=7957 RepID=A0A6P6R5U6_CARAU|nr:uncharacterized protein LOC113116764 [Carassius auratus]
MLQIILLLLPGVVSVEWGVSYPPPICAARGSNVTINCTFIYPHGYTVTQVRWCSMRSNTGHCHNPPYVYDSGENNNQINFQYIGNKTSDCSLLISNINQSHSGVYKFRIITNEEKERWTGDPGVDISVHDLSVSMWRSREHGSTKPGDSVNLTCTLNCSGSLAEVQWFKNGDLIHQSDPVLTFSRITAKDSGNYSCSLRHFKTTVSEEFAIYSEEFTIYIEVLIIVVSIFSLVFITAAVILIRRKAKTQRKPTEERKEEVQDSLYSPPQKTAYTNLPEAKDIQQEDEVEYSSVNIKPRQTIQMSVNAEKQDDATIYSAVMNS